MNEQDTPSITVGILVDAIAFDRWISALGVVKKLLTAPDGTALALVRSNEGNEHWIDVARLRRSIPQEGR